MEKGICVICGKEFTKVNKTQIYCGAKCRQIAKNEQKKKARNRRKIYLIDNSFASVELAKESQYMEKYRCHRKDCQSYLVDNMFFPNNCTSLLDIDQEYTKSCPFYKKK